jgi:glycerol-3-phosphate responsive antiterminator
MDKQYLNKDTRIRFVKVLVDTDGAIGKTSQNILHGKGEATQIVIRA